MGFRHQLPVWSPVTLRSVAAGLLPGPTSLTAIEARLRQEYGAEDVVLTASGTVALALAFLATTPQHRRPRVALPAWACPDLLSAADAVDADVALYDLDPHTLEPDLDSLQRALTTEPTAVVVAHWFGLPVDLRRLAPMVADAGARLIDDAAQGVGAVIEGRPAGSGGDLGILSFGRGKGRSGGGGGAVLANTQAAVERLRSVAARLNDAGSGLKSIAGLATQWVFGRPWLYGIPVSIPSLRLGETIYHPSPSLRRMSPRSAAVVDRIWRASAAEVATRQAHAERWVVELNGVASLQHYQAPKNSAAGWLRYPVRAGRKAVDLLASASARRLGVMPGYAVPLSRLPGVASRLVAETPYPGAAELSAGLYSLPTHRLVSASDFSHIRRLVQAL